MKRALFTIALLHGVTSQAKTTLPTVRAAQKKYGAPIEQTKSGTLAQPTKSTSQFTPQSHVSRPAVDPGRLAYNPAANALNNYITSMSNSVRPDIQLMSNKIKEMMNAGNYFGALIYIAAIAKILHGDALAIIEKDPEVLTNIQTVLTEFMKTNEPLIEQIKSNTAQIILNFAKKSQEQSMANVATYAAENIL